MKKIISSLILLAICFVTLPQAWADTPISCSDILKRGLSEGDGEYLVDPDGMGGNEAFLVYCDMTNGGWQLIYNRNNAYFTPDHMVQRYPTEPINLSVNSTSWFIPPDARVWRWEISVDGGESWRGITTAIPDEAFADTHSTVIDVPVSHVSDNTLSSSEPFYYQTFTLEDQCLFGCDSGRATWWGIVNVLQGAGDQWNPGIGGHSDWCELDNNLIAGDNYTWGDNDLEIYLSDYKDIQGNGIGGTNCIPDGPTDLYRYRFWAYEETEIDIKPGSDPNSINCSNAKGVITVAILTTDDFDATTVDHTTVTFEGAGETHVDKKSGEPRRHEEDVNDDGDTDLVFHFRLGDTDLTCDSTEATLTGETFGGQAFEGTDAVRMID